MVKAVGFVRTLRAVQILLLQGVIAAVGPGAVWARDSVTLAWDASTDPAVAGYNLYYGCASRGYTNLVSVGATNVVAISNLAAKVTYFFAATSVTAVGLESDYSDEVSYTVPAPNRPPTLDPISNLTINQGAPQQTVGLSGITSGAPDENQTLIVAVTSSNPGLIPDLAAHYSSPATTGTLTFTPAPLAAGVATLTVVVDDGGTSSNTVSRTFTLTVNAVNYPPTIAPLADLVLNENAGPQTVTLANITAGATNEAQSLTVTAVSSNPNLVPNPSVTYTSPNTTGTLSLAPSPNAYGSATITVVVSDGQPTSSTVSRSFLVTVKPVNQPPTLAPLADLVLNENAGSQTVTLANITAGATNEAQSLTVTAVSSNPNLVPNPSVTYTSPNTTGTLSLAPSPNAYGSATITVVVSDGQPTSSTVSRSFLVTVNPVNQPPTLAPLADLVLNENAGPQTVTLANITAGATNEAQSLTVTAVSSNPNVVPNPTVTYTSPNTTGTLNLAPSPNAYGSATITVVVSDGQPTSSTVSRSFLVTVNPVNQPPTLAPLADLVLNENAGPQTVTLANITAGATNEAQSLTVTAVSSNPNVVPNPSVTYTSPNPTGTLNLAPSPNAYGSATITVVVSDGQATNSTVSRSFLVTVNPVNQPPTLTPLADLVLNENAGPKTVTLANITSGATNEAQSLTVTAVSSNPNVVPNPTVTYTSPNPTGTLSLAPSPSAYGSATITVVVSDGQPTSSTVSRSFLVTVNPVNQPPTLAPLADLVLNENAGPQTVALANITAGATNEAQSLTVTAVSSNPNVVPNPTVTYTSPNPTGTLNLAPSPNASGSATITVVVSDGQPTSSTVSRSFLVTVNPVNQPPTLAPLADLVLNENAGPQTVTLANITAGATNEAQSLTVTAVSSNPNVVPNPSVTYTSPNPTGTLNLAPSPNASGSATITVVVSDGQPTNSTVSRSFLVTVNLFNQPPTLAPLNNLSLPANAGLQTVALSGIGSGATNESQALTVTALSSNPKLIPPPGVTYTSPNPTGTLTFRPAANGFGTALITVLVDDGQPVNHTITRSFNVQVSPPQGSLTNVVLAPNTSFTCLVPPPLSAAHPSFSLAPDAPTGARIDSQTGWFSWRPTPAQAGTANLITVWLADTDTLSLSSVQTLSIMVSDWLEITLGSTNLQAGQSGALPIYLTSSGPVTNLAFTVDWDASRLSNPILVPCVPGIATNWVLNQTTNLVLCVQTTPTQPLEGSNLIAQLIFQTAPDQSSAFVNVPVTSLTGIKPGPEAYTSGAGDAGEVTVINNNPLLRGAALANPGGGLTSYGTPGATYQLQYATNLASPATWYPLLTFTQTNVAQTLNLTATNPFVLYRLLKASGF